MKSKRFIDSRVGYLLLSVATLLGIVTPSLVPSMASADQLTSRSMAMTSSAAGATSVSYDLNFTAPTGIDNSGGMVLEFCSDSPLIGLACTHPTGMSTSGVTLTDVKVNGTSLGANKGTVAAAASNYGIKWTAAASSGNWTAGQTVEFIFGGITNPSTANSNLFGRITTYLAANLSGYTNATTLGTYTDNGAIATSITNSIGVSASVKETMTFCVSKSAPTAGCGGVDAPSVTLGEGSPQALTTTTVSTGTVYSQISTNAASGAVVKMTNDTGCGGLKRVGASGCDIAPIGTTGTLNTALTSQSNGAFGISLGTPAGVGSSFGTVTDAATYGLAANTYAMDNTTSGNNVSSPYGGTIYSSTAPVANMNVLMNLAAVAGLTTPAGAYKANLNLVATGTY